MIRQTVYVLERRCSKCNQSKAVKHFGEHRNKNNTHTIYYNSWCNECKKAYRDQKPPWWRTYRYIQTRTNGENVSNKYYKTKNIKCRITLDELKFLWFRDKAYLLKKPSIDRIKRDGDYTVENCRYIELDENRKRAIKTIKLKAKKDMITHDTN